MLLKNRELLEETHCFVFLYGAVLLKIVILPREAVSRLSLSKNTSSATTVSLISRRK